MQQWRKPRTLSRVADIASLPRHPIRYHVGRGHIPIRRRSHKVHHHSDVELRVICGYFGVSWPTELESVIL
jgi:hypothetical protein